MAGEWRELPFSEAVLVNPSVQLERGSRYPFVDMGAVNPRSRCAYATEEREFSGGGSRFQHGDTLMARITPCLENGKIARFCAHEGSRVGHGSTEFIVIRGRPDITDTGFAYYLTQWEEVRSYAIGQMTGTSGRQRVPTDSLGYLVVPVPPLPEQRAIAHILGTLDDKIELNRKQNETLEAMARALFKAWFVDFEPVRAKMEGRWQRGRANHDSHLPGLPAHLYDLFPDRLVESELGEIPEGWEAGTLAEIVELVRDHVNPLSEPASEFLHFSIPAFDEGRWPKLERGEEIKSPKWQVPPEVVLLSKLNPEIERVWLVDVKPDDRAVCSTEFLVLRPKPPYGRAYVYCLTRSPLFRQRIEGLVTGTSKSHQRVQPIAILELATIKPSAPVVTAFDRAAASLLDHSSECRRESRTLAALRDALLPKLISGEIRVKDAERFLKERGL
jgi:type I restriction enzyme S subunit